MKKLIFCLTCIIALIGIPSSAYASDEGALLGGLTGGIICSNVGQGTGRSAAIAYCATIGAVLGDRMSNRQLGMYGTGQPTYYSPYRYSSSYSYQQPSYSVYGMDVEAAKARGKADRMREEQRRAIDRAYWCGYNGTCE